MNYKKVLKGQNRLFSTLINTFSEIQIPVPWGQISGKWWGDRSLKPAIAIHEFRQNAAAFDNFIPKLHEPSVLAIDLPGHGKSSPFPTGRFPAHIDFLIALRYISNHLPQGQIRFIGHGLGSSLALTFAASYYQDTSSVISIECTRHVTSALCCPGTDFSLATDRLFEIEKCPVEPITHDDILALVKRTGPMTQKAAEILLSRAVERRDSGLYFANDSRYELQLLQPIPDQSILTMAEFVRCKVLVIRNAIEDTLPPLNDDELAKSPFVDESSHKLIRRKGPLVVKKLNAEGFRRFQGACHYLEHKEVNENNHLLLDSSDLVAGLVNDYLSVSSEVHKIYLDSLDHLQPQPKP